MIENRACFLEKDEFKLTIPILEKQAYGAKIVDNYEKVCTIDEFVETLWELEESDTELPIFLLVMKYFKNPHVCCTAIGLREPYLSLLITLESACSDYQVLPYPGGLMNQPQFIYDAFQCIRVGRNEYFRVRDEEWKAKIKSDK